jgi:antitoxin (DNA-binding transcriptional repressor) of toxin-antitoxin stability system
MRELRPSLTTVVKDVCEGRRPFVVITSNDLPVAALVPVHRDGSLDVVHALAAEAEEILLAEQGAA